MKTKYLFFAALVGMTLASCSSDDIAVNKGANLGDENSSGGAIGFGSSFKAVTRAGNAYGAAAADLLGNQFIVSGVKGDGTGTGQIGVFKSYTVEWKNNTAGKTESNTADWDYVAKDNKFGSAMGQVDVQTIKYWDYSTDAYDFAAYSVGKGITLTPKTADNIASDPAPGSGVVYATPILYNATQIPSSDPAKYQISNAYMLRGALADLSKCYITDMNTVTRTNYQKEVQFNFLSLGSKVRIALYETIPGYSVKNVYFYQDATTARNTDISANTSATLFGTGVFYSGGIYTISFPHIGSGNSSDPDYNKAHVAISGSTTVSKQAFGTLNYTTTKENSEADGNYLQRTASNPSFAGTGTFFNMVLPNESGVSLNLRVNYTLVATDGSGEEITIYGATAQIPATYTKWLPNYAYTYIFKISDNTNGWTSPTIDPVGLYPITFDAVVLNNEESGNQTTIPTVATPSISTYQKGHVYNASEEYKAGEIYVQAVGDGTLKSDLNTKGKLYSMSALETEAKVMDALNIRESVDGSNITGRNGLVLTNVAMTYPTTIPGEDNSNISVADNTTAKIAATASTNYAFVYEVATGTPSEFNTAVELTTKPTDWNAENNVYYTDFACTQKANVAFAAGTYYKKYTNLNNTYGVKVIKVAAGS